MPPLAQVFLPCYLKLQSLVGTLHTVDIFYLHPGPAFKRNIRVSTHSSALGFNLARVLQDFDKLPQKPSAILRVSDIRRGYNLNKGHTGAVIINFSALRLVFARVLFEMHLPDANAAKASVLSDG
ncbi:hypothetical protein BMS3Bbin16_01165 [archaeon BMS3Bbin16]|nr:hypothetical protein BMS3Bbin16_01165 [archaeon BMS3Bbin16]